MPLRTLSVMVFVVIYSKLYRAIEAIAAISSIIMIGFIACA